LQLVFKTLLKLCAGCGWIHVHQIAILLAILIAILMGHCRRGIAMFRAVAALAREESLAITAGSFFSLVLLTLGGYLLAKGGSDTKYA